MANRFTEVSTSSFKPLSLDEIMAVPLAKQAQHDESMLALDEFAKMEANSLDKDKAYVTGQIQALQKESDGISNQLLEKGVDKDLTNKIRGLRNRKNQEFSLQGKTGQASAAYNQFQANKSAIDARKDLTAAQKEAGLARAKNNYLGVVEGGEYEDYVGTAHVDIMEKGREIASKMTPQEIAQVVGMTYNPATKYYSDGNYITKVLKPEQIAKVVYQGLKSDRLVTDYAQELGDLGIESDPDKMIMDAALNAGNVFQVNNQKEDANFRASSGDSLDSSVGPIDADQPWNSRYLENMQAAFNNNYSLTIPENEVENMFNYFTGEIRDMNIATDEVKQADRDEKIALFNKMRRAGNMTWKEYNASMMALDIMNPDQDKNALLAKKIGKTISQLKTDNPNLQGKSDKEVYKLYNDAQQRATKSFSQVVKPMNPKSTYKALEADLIGSGDQIGNIMSKTVMLSNGEVMAYNEIFKKDEYDHMSKKELNEAIRKTGKVIGFAPGLVQMPGASVVQFEDPDGDMHTMYVMPDEKEKAAFASVGKMNDAIINGTNYVHEQGRNGIHEHIITELSDRSGRYESAVIRSEEEISNEDLRTLEWKRSSNPEFPGAQESEWNGKLVIRYDFDDEVQRTTNEVTRFYDKTPNKNQLLSEAQKN